MRRKPNQSRHALGLCGLAQVRRYSLPLCALLFLSVCAVTCVGAEPSATAGAHAESRAIPAWMFHLPSINACFNGLSTVLLTAGFIFIRRRNELAHRRCMLAALVSSSLFLIGYITYHAVVHHVTHFVNPAWFRPVYLTILLTHTVLAVVIVPMVLTTVTFALRGRLKSHRKIARWTWPLWMYVSVTGVVIYLLLYQIFPQS